EPPRRLRHPAAPDAARPVAQIKEHRSRIKDRAAAGGPIRPRSRRESHPLLELGRTLLELGRTLLDSGRTLLDLGRAGTRAARSQPPRSQPSTPTEASAARSRVPRPPSSSAWKAADDASAGVTQVISSASW